MKLQQLETREPDVAAGALIRCGTVCGLDKVPEDRGMSAAGPGGSFFFAAFTLALGASSALPALFPIFLIHLFFFFSAPIAPRNTFGSTKRPLVIAVTV